MNGTTKPRLAFAFALLATVLALATMQALGTPLLDRGAYRIGIGLTGAVGFLTGIVLHALQGTRFRARAWVSVLVAGALVGMAMQLVLLLRMPETRTYVLSSGLTTADPVGWVIAGAPLGALPAGIVAAVVAFAFRMVSPSPAQDARERITLPFAGACALFGAIALGGEDATDVPIAASVVFLAFAALLEVAVRDRARLRWLRRVFAGEESLYEVLPLTAYPTAVETPLVVGAVMPQAVIVKVAQRGYRGAGISAVGVTALDEHVAVAPLLLRRTCTIGLSLATVAAGVIAIAVR